MGEQAKVTSLDALETIRASLIIFANRAHRSLDEVGDEVRRTRMWVENDQRLHWESEIRKRRRILDQAVQELLSAKLSNLRDNISAQENAVRKAKAAMAEAEDKLRRVKQWNRDFEHATGPLTKRLEGLRQFLVHDLPKGMAFLVQAQKTLEAYSESPPPAAANDPAPVAEEQS